MHTEFRETLRLYFFLNTYSFSYLILEMPSVSCQKKRCKSSHYEFFCVKNAWECPKTSYFHKIIFLFFHVPYAEKIQNKYKKNFAFIFQGACSHFLILLSFFILILIDLIKKILIYAPLHQIKNALGIPGILLP